jgi:hypothetical protein
MNISWLWPAFTLHELSAIVIVLRPFTPEPHEWLQPWTIGAAGERHRPVLGPSMSSIGRAGRTTDPYLGHPCPLSDKLVARDMPPLKDQAYSYVLNIMI